MRVNSIFWSIWFQLENHRVALITEVEMQQIRAWKRLWWLAFIEIDLNLALRIG